MKTLLLIGLLLLTSGCATTAKFLAVMGEGMSHSMNQPEQPVQVQPIDTYKPINCHTNRIGNQYYTNCY